MDKKLPKVFANKIEKELNNNEKVYYSNKDKGQKFVNKKNKPSTSINKNINQKINTIFNSSKYVYKANVDITLKSGKVTKKIIGKNSANLITIDGELIPINEIEDIEFTK